MLSLSLRAGEYITIGDGIVLQIDTLSGNHAQLLIDAPREVRILRGEVLERNGEQRPESVKPDRSHWGTASIPWDRSRAQALNAMRAQLDKMDGSDDGVRALRRQLNHMFPKTEH